jgi:hypothetical protein
VRLLYNGGLRAIREQPDRWNRYLVQILLRLATPTEIDLDLGRGFNGGGIIGLLEALVSVRIVYQLVVY